MCHLIRFYAPWVGDPQTRKQYHRSSPIQVGTPSPSKVSPAEGSGVGRTSPPSTRLGRSVGFAHRSTAGLGKTDSTLGGAPKVHWASEKQWPHGSRADPSAGLRGLPVAGSRAQLCLFLGTWTQLVEIPGSICLRELWPRADTLLDSLTLLETWPTQQPAGSSSGKTQVKQPMR